MNITSTPPEEDNEILKAFFAAGEAARKLAREAAYDLKTHSPALISAIASGTGQGARISRLVRSCWNGHYKTGLCDDLCGLDNELALAVSSLIRARLFMGGDADPLIRHILVKSGEMDLMQEETEP